MIRLDRDQLVLEVERRSRGRLRMKATLPIALEAMVPVDAVATEPTELVGAEELRANARVASMRFVDLVASDPEEAARDADSAHGQPPSPGQAHVSSLAQGAGHRPEIGLKSPLETGVTPPPSSGMLP